MNKNLTEKQKKSLKVLYKRACVFLIACALLLFSLFFQNSINCVLNKTSFCLSNNFQNSKLKVHFIDVGQGDCTFMQIGETSIMIDAGTPNSVNHIKNYLNNLGFKKDNNIDFLILTHTDSDHIGGASELLDYFEFENVYRPKAYSSFEVDNNLVEKDYNIFYSNLWREVCEKIYAEVDSNHLFYNFAGECINGEEFKINFYSPTIDKYENSNDYSPIMILQTNSFKFAFVGDASGDVEEQFLIDYEQYVSQSIFDCDVLKVAHHGSSSSTTDKFLKALSPEVAVISCAMDNSYNHPSDEVVNRLSHNNVEILRTDTMDSIVIYEDSNVLNIRSKFMGVGSIYIEWKYIVLSLIVLLFSVIVLPKIKV